MSVARERWAAIERAYDSPPASTFAAVAAEFARDYIPTKAPKTQREYRLALARLVAVFGAAELDAVRPSDVGRLKRELRDVPQQFRALRACLSVLWNWSREVGHTERPNPCTGVRGYGARPRDVDVTPAMYYAVYDQAEAPLQDFMDLAIVVGARPSDVLRLTTHQARDGALETIHAKRRRRTSLALEHDLAAVLERIQARPRRIASVYLIADADGQPVTYWRLRGMFDRARAAAERAGSGELARWQLRDLRAASATQAATLQEAQDRLAHDDPATTRRVYQRRIRAIPGRLPKRPGGA